MIKPGILDAFAKKINIGMVFIYIKMLIYLRRDFLILRKVSECVVKVT